MSDEEKNWLRKLLGVLKENPEAYFSYTTSDDGVWISFGESRFAELNLGFSHSSAIEALERVTSDSPATS